MLEWSVILIQTRIYIWFHPHCHALVLVNNTKGAWFTQILARYITRALGSMDVSYYIPCANTVPTVDPSYDPMFDLHAVTEYGFTNACSGVLVTVPRL